jgi:crotonobetainyl-CoA:carnitine CoA-transferase CaiB-like acyl-CoA transferase
MNSSQENSTAPLRNIKVLDFSTFLAGPFCTQILADLGADVIKVEGPHGDSSRSIPPHFVADDSLYYLSVNRNKRSIVIDLKNPAGHDLALTLIGKVDVVVENFGPGVGERLGLDAEEMRAKHPALVWSSITGFGKVGLRSDLPAYDLIVQALSGVMTITGHPGADPVRLGIPAGDLIAGLYSCIGILAGLLERGRDTGRQVDVAMFDALLATVSYLGAYALSSGAAPGRQGSRHESIPTYREFVAGDGVRLVVTANTERMWRDLCAVLGREDLTADPRFGSAAARLANKEALWPHLEEAFRSRTAEEWVQGCNDRDVPAALVQDVVEALGDARKDSRSMVLRIRGHSGHAYEVIGNPVKYLGEAGTPPVTAPRLGEHTRRILADLVGLDEDEIERLLTDRAVQSASDEDRHENGA